MLHAICSNKSQLPAHRYVASANAQDARRTQEDEITSTVFGPLDFMPGADLVKVIGVLFEGNLSPRSTNISIKFWPSYNKVEPDVVFLEYLDNGAKNAYVVEVKWNAPLGEEQVERQIDAVMMIEGIHSISHIVLSRHALDVDAPSRNLTWMDFKDRIIDFKKSASTDRAITKWVDLVDCFLDRCNIRHFRGFSDIMVPDMAGRSIESVIFWPGFQGWECVEHPQEPFGDHSGEKVIFWQTASGNKGDVTWKA